MKEIALTWLFLALAVITAAQPTSSVEAEQNLRMLGNLTPLSPGAQGFDNRYEGVKGTPYWFEEWRLGRIKFVKQDTFSTLIPLTIDAARQMVLVKLQNGSIGEMSATYVKGVVVSHTGQQPGQEFAVYPEGEVEGIKSVRLRFYEVLHPGDFSLLKSVHKHFRKANFQGAYASGERYDEFLTEEKYWLCLPNKPYVKVSLKRKEIEKALADYQSQIAEIVKTQKLNLNNEEDIVQLLRALSGG